MITDTEILDLIEEFCLDKTDPNIVKYSHELVKIAQERLLRHQRVLESLGM